MLVSCLTFAVSPEGHAQGLSRPALRIVVIAGEDAINVIQQKTAVTPIVEVRDRNDQPVAGAVVLFAVRSGRATFRGSRTLTVTTNSAGRAVAEGFLPASAGPMEVSVTATYQGQSAVAVTVAQTNVETAAEVAMQRPTSNATKGGRSLGKVAGWSAAAGAAVAGAIALGSRRGDAVPAIGQVSASHGVALQSSSQVSFAVSLTQGGCPILLGLRRRHDVERSQSDPCLPGRRHQDCHSDCIQRRRLRQRYDEGRGQRTERLVGRHGVLAHLLAWHVHSA